MKAWFRKTILLLPGLLVAERMSADGDIIPTEVIAITGLLGLAAAFLLLYVTSSIVFSIMNKRNNKNKKNKKKAILLGFILLSIFIVSDLNLLSSWFAWPALAFLGALLGYYLSPEEEEGRQQDQAAEDGSETS